MLLPKQQLSHSWFRLAVVAVGLLTIPAVGVAQTPIDQLIFKATHNSYACGGSNDPPVMHHPLDQQINNFGVWALELDFSIFQKNGLHVGIGHDGYGEATCFGKCDDDGNPECFALGHYLGLIQSAIARAYRPVFLYFDKKAWNRPTGTFPFFERADDPTFDPPAQYLPVLERELSAVFGADNIFGPKALERFHRVNDRYPTIRELAQKIIPVVLQGARGTDLIFHDGPVDLGVTCDGCPPGWPGLNLNADFMDHCTAKSAIEKGISTGVRLEDEDAPRCAGGCRLFRLDQYQEDFTYEFGVPPNPLVVDFAALAENNLPASESATPCESTASIPVPSPTLVHEQGTFRFPYRTLGGASLRARGFESGETVNRTAGLGWTILIRPGVYSERVVLHIPLILKKDDRFDGTVVIGR